MAAKNKSDNRKRFEGLLVTIETSQDTLYAASVEASQMAFLHAKATRNCNWLTDLHERLRKNMIRRDALVKWACDNGPILFVEGRFKMDKGPKALPWNVEVAMEKSFYDAKAAIEITNYGAGNIVEEFKKFRDKFHNGNRRRPANDRAKQAVDLLDVAFSNFEEAVRALPAA